MSSFLLWNKSRSTRLCLGLSIGMVLGGCTVSSRSAYIDSTSRMPWFGLELKGRKPKSDDPPFRSVRLENRDATQVTPAGLFNGTTNPVQTANSSSTRPISMSLPVAEQIPAVRPESGLTVQELDFH